MFGVAIQNIGIVHDVFNEKSTKLKKLDLEARICYAECKEFNKISNAEILHYYHEPEVKTAVRELKKVLKDIEMDVNNTL